MITPGAPIEQISEAHDISPFFTVAIPGDECDDFLDFSLHTRSGHRTFG